MSKVSRRGMVEGRSSNRQRTKALNKTPPIGSIGVISFWVQILNIRGPEASFSVITILITIFSQDFNS